MLSYMYVVCGLGAGTCKLVQASIAAEALGHCKGYRACDSGSEGVIRAKDT